MNHLLVGAPASGKSTLAAQLKEKLGDTVVVISTDSIRESLYGDEEIQGKWPEVEAEVLRRAQEAWDQGLSVIYDATNAQKEHRRSIIRRFRSIKPDSHWVGWYIPASEWMCRDRNSSRKRRVPDQVIKSMLVSLEAYPPTIADGLVQVFNLKDWLYDSTRQVDEYLKEAESIQPDHVRPVLTDDVASALSDARHQLYRAQDAIKKANSMLPWEDFEYLNRMLEELQGWSWAQAGLLETNIGVWLRELEAHDEAYTEGRTLNIQRKGSGDYTITRAQKTLGRIKGSPCSQYRLYRSEGVYVPERHIRASEWWRELDPLTVFEGTLPACKDYARFLWEEQYK